MYHTDHLEFLLDDADDPDVGGEEEGEGDGEAEGETTGTGEAEVGAGEGRKRKISMLESAEKAFLENPRILFFSSLQPSSLPPLLSSFEV